MGNNFCVCDGDNNNEKESNIFSVIPRANNLPKEEEYKTLSIENKLTQGSNYKTFTDYNTSINNKMVFNLKNKHVNRSLKKIYLNTELLNLNKKFNNINISNTSINNDENESCKIKSVSNTIFNKKNKYHNLRKILLNKNI